MKKFLSIILTIAIVLSLAVCPSIVSAKTSAESFAELESQKGDNWEPVLVIDMGTYQKKDNIVTTSLGNSIAPSLTHGGSNGKYKDPETGLEYPAPSIEADAVTKEDIIKQYPFLENDAMNDKYMKFTQINAGGGMFRLNNIHAEDFFKLNEMIRISMEICITDMVSHVEQNGTEVPVDNSCADACPYYFILTPGSGGGTEAIANKNVPVNKWTTLVGYHKYTDLSLDSIKFGSELNSSDLRAVSNPYPKTIFFGKITYERIRNNNQPIESNINYTEDFEEYKDAEKKYTIDGSDVTIYGGKSYKEVSSTDKKLPFITEISEADTGVLGEANMTYKDSANPNDKSKYAIGSVTYDGNKTYEYVYPTAGTALGKYHLTGDSSLGDTGVTNATFGIGYGETEYFSTSEHLSAADRLASSTAKRTSFTLPKAYSGKHMLVASGLYNKNASVRMDNIFGSHPSKADVGKKMIISYYVYADSKMGAYKVSDKDYASAEPVSVDITKPVKLMTSFNGPMGNIYKYRLSYDDTAVANIDIPWDTWTKVQILCEITSESIDNLVIENAGNTLKNCLQISQFGATDQIADTLYFDNLSVEAIEAGTKAEYAVYKFDGSYDIAVKILSSTEAGNPTVQLVVGEYDAVDGRLLSVKTSANKTFSFSQLPIAISVSDFKPIKETSTLRAFLIDSYTGLCPYIAPTDVKVIADIIE